MPPLTSPLGVPYGSSGPASQGTAITKSDATIVSYRALWVGGAGDLVVVFLNDPTSTPVTIAGVPAGTLLPFAVKQVRAATTATLIVGLN